MDRPVIIYLDEGKTEEMETICETVFKVRMSKENCTACLVPEEILVQAMKTGRIRELADQYKVWRK